MRRQYTHAEREAAALALRELSRPPAGLNDQHLVALHWDKLDSATIFRLQQQYLVRDILQMANTLRERVYGTAKYNLTAEEVFQKIEQMMVRGPYELPADFDISMNPPAEGKAKRARKRKLEQADEATPLEMPSTSATVDLQPQQHHKRPAGKNAMGGTQLKRIPSAEVDMSGEDAQEDEQQDEQEDALPRKIVVLKFERGIELRGGKWRFGGWLVEPVEKRPKNEIVSAALPC